MSKIQWIMNSHRKPSSPLPFFDIEKRDQALHFHRTLPGYFPTPLFSLSSLAQHLGVQDILVKDESFRFHLNSFKALGSSYALAAYLAHRYGHKSLSFSLLKEKVKNFPPLTFATATAGNHGRGLAWAAKQFDQHAVIYMPRDSSPDRLNQIQQLGAQASMTSFSYDETVRYASHLSSIRDWILIQDTAWEGYEDIPLMIMQGYLTILGEYTEQLAQMGKEPPTHVILQAGVGSFAGAMVAGLEQLIQTPVTFIIVEPTSADCLFQSSCSIEGIPTKASGDLSTRMAGLCCAEPNPVAWNILKRRVNCFVICSDDIAAQGMHALANPLPCDPCINSGESGAAPLGLLYELCTNPLLANLKESLQIHSASRLLWINTEGK